MSEIGKEYQTPSIPKYLGNIKTKGIRKTPCLIKVRKRAGFAFPIA